MVEGAQSREMEVGVVTDREVLRVPTAAKALLPQQWTSPSLRMMQLFVGPDSRRWTLVMSLFFVNLKYSEGERLPVASSPLVFRPVV